MEKVIIGNWDGEPIWREKTAEEKLAEMHIDKEVLDLYIALNENYNG